MPNDEEREEIAISLRLNAQVERIREAVLGGTANEDFCSHFDAREQQPPTSLSATG